MIAEDLKLRYKRLIEKQELTEEEKLELKQLNEQLFPGSSICRDLLKQYSIEDISILFD